MASLADKIQNNQGIKVSDVVATQAALGATIGAAAEMIGGYAGGRGAKHGKIIEGLGTAASKLAVVYSATAYTMSKTKVDAAVWDPANKTGLPKFSELSSEDFGKMAEVGWDNSKSEFNKTINDFAEDVRKFDEGFKEGVSMI